MSQWLPLRFALRELRGGLRGFYVFIACIALGVMSIAGVGSLAASLANGLAQQGQVILGGDLAFTLVQRQAKPDELAFLRGHGKVSSAATLRAMAREGNGQATLVELKAVDAAYPLFGTVTLDPPGQLAAALAERAGAYGAVADPTLLARLALKPGARLTARQRHFRNPRRAHRRARQARRRHRLRPAPDGERSGLARHRPVAAGQPGALALPAAPAGRAAKRCRLAGGG